MIYSTNRTASLGEMTVDVNESYFGAGAFMYAQECAQDELAIFENAIKSDIDECIIGESTYELQALNEGFIESAKNKIKDIMKKFIAWLDAVIRSAIAKLSQLLVRDNAKFVKIAKNRIAKMKNPTQFKYSGKYIKHFNFSEIATDFDATVFTNLIGKDNEAAKKKIDEEKTKMTENTVSNVLDPSKGNIVGEAENMPLSIINMQIATLEKLSKKDIKDLKDKCNKYKTDAAKFVKTTESKLKEINDDEANKDKKEEAQTAVELANAFKQLAQDQVKFSMSVLKGVAKIARAAVAKAMGATPKEKVNESYDEELTDAMIEAANYEYDEALEEMSEGADCDDCDDDIDDDEE